MLIAIKLDDDNFLIWEQHILATIRGLKFDKFVRGDAILPCFSIKENEIAKAENLEYINYVQQDQLFVAWLLASMFSPILTKMVGLKFAHQIWKRLEVYYAACTLAVIKKLKLQLRMIKKDKGINEYLLEIKKTVDSLLAVGSSIFGDQDHIDAILDGCLDDFDDFVTSITSRLDPYTVDEIKALLLTQERNILSLTSILSGTKSLKELSKLFIYLHNFKLLTYLPNLSLVLNLKLFEANS
uniref:Retrovirus-related Pol polyprotein from transposon TNT 1-94 n=1 Tax=Cajanus cajan TaxID=3821 RepID=A0A151QPW4_CAJCA|nr:hypothetical protein KK1_046996 [Cajanus cajan]